MTIDKNHTPNNFSSNLKDDIQEHEITLETVSQIRPWVRFAARSIDLDVYFILLLPLLGGINTLLEIYNAPKITTIWSGLVIYLFAWIFIEPIFLSTWGTTVGKWLFKTRLRDREGNKLTYKVALKRCFLVLMKGYVFHIPLASLIGQIIAYRKLKHNGLTSWDKSCQTTLIHDKIGKLRGVLILLLFMGLIIVNSILT
jgi:uncharacterized RDD family membrane protein YckC